MGGSSDGKARTRRVFPTPLAPRSNRLWPPAAAISIDRLACHCPRILARSISGSGKRGFIMQILSQESNRSASEESHLFEALLYLLVGSSSCSAHAFHLLDVFP